MKLYVPLLVLLGIGLSGCSQLNPTPGDGLDWDRINRGVENITEITALIAFSRDDVKPYKEQICIATDEVSTVLANYEDPDATFEALRGAALNAVKNLPDDVLPGNSRRIAVLVIDQVLDVVFVYVEDSYMDLINKDKTIVVLNVAQSAAKGLDAACEPQVTLFSGEQQSSGISKFKITKE